MGDREAQYDPYIPSGGTTGESVAQKNATGNQRTAALQAVSQANVESLTFVMSW